MTRNNAREIAMQMVFSLGFTNADVQDMLDRELQDSRFRELAEESALYGKYPNRKQEEYIRTLVRGTWMHAPELDGYISRLSRNWAFARIPRMAVAIMRTAMYEMLYMPDVPNPAAINAALDIARHYESPEVVSFINGILGTFSREECGDTAPRPEKSGKPPVTDADFDPPETGRVTE